MLNQIGSGSDPGLMVSRFNLTSSKETNDWFPDRHEAYFDPSIEHLFVKSWTTNISVIGGKRQKIYFARREAAI